MSEPTPDAPAEPADPHRSLRTGIATLLNVGTIAAAVVLLAGLALLVKQGAPPQVGNFAARTRESDSIARILSDVLQGKPDAIAMLGVILLVFIPAARTLAAAVVFAKERDRLFTLLALVIVATLVISAL
jgi:uncharacterized membrane protein